MNRLSDLAIFLTPSIATLLERAGRRDLAERAILWASGLIGALRLAEAVDKNTTEAELRALCWTLADELGDDPTASVFRYLATTRAEPIDLSTLIGHLHDQMGKAYLLATADRIAAVWRVLVAVQTAQGAPGTEDAR